MRKWGVMARRSDLERAIQQTMITMIANIVLFNHAASASLGLGASDSQFLTLLQTRGAMTPGQLAEGSGLTSGTVTGVIDRLEKAKLVRRERDDGDRGRCWWCSRPTRSTAWRQSMPVKAQCWSECWRTERRPSSR